MSPHRKVEFISSSAPFVTTEGQRYGKRPINLNQPIEYIAQETACYFNMNLLEYQFEQDTNSLLVIMTSGFRVRLWFKVPKDLVGKKEFNHGQENGFRDPKP